MNVIKIIFIVGLLALLVSLAACAMVPSIKTSDGRDELRRAFGVANVLYLSTKTVLIDAREQKSIDDETWKKLLCLSKGLELIYRDSIRILDELDVEYNEGDVALLRYSTRKLVEKAEELLAYSRPYISDEVYISIVATISTIRIIFRQEGV